MSPSASEQDWTTLYLQHHRPSPASLRVLRALHAALGRGESPTAYELAQEAVVDRSTGVRVRARLAALGVIRLTRPRPIAGGGSERFTYEALWPPVPPSPHR